MSPGWRAFYGAACGALAVLLIHPASRPFLLLPLTHWGESETFAHTPLILENQKQLRPPRTLMDASLLMENGARTVAIRRGLQPRSEEHTSELQSLTNLVCRLLLEKKK